MEKVRKTSWLQSIRYKIPNILIYAILILFALMAIVPVLWLIMSSVKTQAGLFQDIWGLPKEVHLDNFVKAFNRSNMYYYMRNSLMVTGLTILFTLITSVPLSFGLARFKFKFNRLIYYIVIAGMMIPIQSAIIPLYMSANNWGLLNSRFYLAIIYAAFRIPVSVFILESFMRVIPKEMEESAIIDGCNIWQLFYKVFVPMTKNGILSIIVLSVLATWNELLVGLVMITNNLHKTLPVGVIGFINEYASNYVLMIAGVVLSFIPNLIFYMLLQNRLQKGVRMGAIKG
ncbi:MAG: carbohydrate ABC transporter permease [Halothermotrichaceae bacterium]